MKNVKISIIIPVYKVEQYIKDCVDSVLNQTYKNLEVILVDDGSPDGSPGICDEYAQSDNRVMVIHKINGGLSDARNEGLKVASGDYVMFLDSDDYYKHNDFLEKVAEATDDGKIDAVFFKRTVFYEDSDRPNGTYPPYNLEWNKLWAPEILLNLAKFDMLDASACMKATKRSILLGSELYFKKGMYCEDIEWFSRYILFINSIALINYPDYYYRKREGSITATLKEKNVRDLFLTIQEHSLKIRESAIEEKRKRAILSYHSYQYYIVLGLTNNILRGRSRSEIYGELKAYKWLTNYSISRKTEVSATLLKMFGMRITGKILGYYIIKK